MNRWILSLAATVVVYLAFPFLYRKKYGRVHYEKAKNLALTNAIVCAVGFEIFEVILFVVILQESYIPSFYTAFLYYCIGKNMLEEKDAHSISNFGKDLAKLQEEYKNLFSPSLFLKKSVSLSSQEIVRLYQTPFAVFEREIIYFEGDRALLFRTTILNKAFAQYDIIMNDQEEKYDRKAYDVFFHAVKPKLVSIVCEIREYLIDFIEIREENGEEFVLADTDKQMTAFQSVERIFLKHSEVFDKSEILRWRKSFFAK